MREHVPEAEVASLLADAALEAHVAATDDPLARALAEGARRKRTLLTEAGGGLSSDTVASQLHVTRQAVDKRRRRGALLAVPMPTGDWIYPIGQFRPDGRPLDGIADVLQAFRIRDPWMQLDQLLPPDPVLDGKSALAALRKGGRGAVPAVLAQLRLVGEQGT